MDPLSKLIQVRDRLSTLLQAENETAPDHVKQQLVNVIDQLNQSIAEFASERNMQAQMATELQRTTGKPLKPGEDGPHPVKYGI